MRWDVDVVIGEFVAAEIFEDVGVPRGGEVDVGVRCVARLFRVRKDEGLNMGEIMITMIDFMSGRVRNVGWDGMLIMRWVSLPQCFGVLAKS